MLIRHLWQLKTVVLLHWCLIRAVLLMTLATVMTHFIVQRLLMIVTFECHNIFIVLSTDVNKNETYFDMLPSLLGHE